MTMSDFKLVLIDDNSFVISLTAFELASLLVWWSANVLGYPWAAVLIYVWSETSGILINVLFELDVVVDVAFEFKLLFRKLVFELLAVFDILGLNKYHSMIKNEKRT